MECPHCSKPLSPAMTIPDEQRFVMELEFAGKHLTSKTLGGSITNMDKLLVAIAKDAGVKVATFIENIEWKEHSARVTFVIIAARSSVSANNGEAPQ